jgi:hypothetical protein
VRVWFCASVRDPAMGEVQTIVLTLRLDRCCSSRKCRD